MVRSTSGNKMSDTAMLTRGTANKPGTGGPAGDLVDDAVTPGGGASGTITFTLFHRPDDLRGRRRRVPARTRDEDPDRRRQLRAGQLHAGFAGHLHLGRELHRRLAEHEERRTRRPAPITSEDVVVRQIPTHIKTKQSWYPNDTATITSTIGNLAAGGTVAFNLYATDDCSGAALFSREHDVTGGNNSAEVSTTTPAHVQDHHRLQRPRG